MDVRQKIAMGGTKYLKSGLHNWLNILAPHTSEFMKKNHTNESLQLKSCHNHGSGKWHCCTANFSWGDQFSTCMQIGGRVQPIYCPSSSMWVGLKILRVIAVSSSSSITWFVSYRLSFYTSDISCEQIIVRLSFISFLQACINPNVHVNKFILCISINMQHSIQYTPTYNMYY